MTLIEGLRADAAEFGNVAPRLTRKMALAADRIELLEGALKTAHDVFAGEIEGLHRIILQK